MRYPYFDILINMATANVAQTHTLRMHSYRDSIHQTNFGPKLKSITYYCTPNGDFLLNSMTGDPRYE